MPSTRSTPITIRLGNTLLARLRAEASASGQTLSALAAAKLEGYTPFPQRADEPGYTPPVPEKQRGTPQGTPPTCKHCGQPYAGARCLAKSCIGKR